MSGVMAPVVAAESALPSKIQQSAKNVSCWKRENWRLIWQARSAYDPPVGSNWQMRIARAASLTAGRFAALHRNDK